MHSKATKAVNGLTSSSAIPSWAALVEQLKTQNAEARTIADALVKFYEDRLRTIGYDHIAASTMVMKNRTTNLHAKRLMLFSFFIVLSLQIAKPIPNSIANNGQEDPSNKNRTIAAVQRARSLSPGGFRWCQMFANKIPNNANPLSISKSSSRLDEAIEEKLVFICQFW